MNIYKTYRDYRLAWDNAYHIDPPVPLNIDIELASVCNLKCNFCYYANPNYPRSKNHFFPVYELQSLLYQIHKLNIPAIKLNWIGEPTLHPCFAPILNHIGTLNFHDVIVNTNGNYPDKINDALIHATKVIFSLDSTIESIYKKMRFGGIHKKVIDNIYSLLNKGHKAVVIRRVINEDNKLEPFCHNVRDLFGDQVSVASHYVFNRNFRSLDEKKHIKHLKRTYCGYPSQRLVVSVDGDVYPCCVDALHTMKLGNIKKDSLMDIWKSKKLAKIRRKLRLCKFPSKTCKNCTSWMSYQTTYRTFVRDRHVFDKVA